MGIDESKFILSQILYLLQLAMLSEDDMRPVVNMEYMGVSVSKKQSAGFHLKIGGKKV